MKSYESYESLLNQIKETEDGEDVGSWKMARVDARAVGNQHRGSGHLCAGCPDRTHLEHAAKKEVK